MMVVVDRFSLVSTECQEFLWECGELARCLAFIMCEGGAP